MIRRAPPPAGPRRARHRGGAATAQVWPRALSADEARPWPILLVEDHVVVRDGLAALLSLEPDFDVCGSVDRVEAALEFLERTPVALIISDLNLPGASGGQAIKALHDAAPAVRLLALTAHDSLEHVRAVFIAGAIGYVCKDAPRSELVRAIRRALKGQYSVCGTVWDAVLEDWLENYRPPERGAAPQLEEHEARVVRMIALGDPTWRIAEAMKRGIKSVEKYRAGLLKRLGLKSTASVTRFAIENGLVSSHELDHMLEDNR